MNVLSLDGVSKTLVDTPLFEQVTLGIDAGERIGFIGRNGAGKSTFLKLIDGELLPDTGSVSRNRELTISRLEQRPHFSGAATLEEASDPSTLPLFLSLCRELGLTDPGAKLDTFSGGMLRKTSIARCLARGAGLVLLDEPTNHLDLETIEWLEDRLRAPAFGFVVVTHDRYFLDEVCTSIMEIDERRIHKYPGNYSEYLDRRAEREEIKERAESRRVSVLRGELEWLKRGPRARTGKDKSRKARIQDLRDSGLQKELAMQELSSTHRRLGTKVLEMLGAGKSFGGRTVIAPFTYSFRRGERIGIIGPNGSGKTTFLRLVAGELEADAGSVARGETTVFGHFAQSNPDLKPGITVIEFMKVLAERIPQERGGSLSPEQFLERFLFPRSMHGVTVDRLSGGEMRRLTLVRLLATAPNFLLFDEPTNDLDLDTIRLLEDYLADFGGCILLVSHDRALLDRLTDYLFVFDGAGGIRGFTGNYEDYRALAAEQEEKRRAAAARQAPPRAERRTAHTEKTGLSFKERKEYEGLLERIEELEQEQKELEASFQAQTTDPLVLDANNRRYREVIGLIEQCMARWEELAARSGD